ncbi:hypothetical protein [Specibacter sp. NPDC078692]|uniref:hypothetical protein n=1 Tax=Specibacter sp. NPDC078692 TaxID=3155818 RepID=UPI00341D5D6E
MNTRQRHAKQEAACLALRAAAVMVAALLVSGCSSSSQQTSPPPQTYLPEPATLQDAVDCSTSTGWEPAATTPAALAVPSERGGPMSCLDYGEILPGIWLINAAGQAVNVQWPMDSCDHYKPGTASALAALTVVSSTPVPKEGTSITP